MFFQLILLATIESAYSLVCYTCSSSNHANCVKQRIECKGYEDMCSTTVYKIPELKNIKDGEMVSKFGYRKGCIDGRKKCDSKCSWWRTLGYQCNTQCCHGNECNKHGINTQRTKRRANVSNKPHYSILLLIGCLLLVKLKSSLFQ